MELQKRVMFVDDEEGVRTSWDRFLSERGFQVLTAHDGQTAIAKLQDHPVDVVVSDFRMPTGDGLKLLAWVKDQQPNTRFILLTGYGSPEIEQRARDLGAYEYLNKPISPETLERVIRTAMQLELLPGKQAAVAAPTVAPTVEEVAAEAVAEPSVEVVRERGWVVESVRTVGGLIAAPLMGLAFVVFLPVIGFAALFWSLAKVVWGAFGSAKAGT